ncbi:serine hydrolase domain-containing protein [Hyalangium gracile]|uniref:serine hydrolase domain-containing protein n=1 Tax=Hyalangium gracile TaxID=394092 RepID=UPI001CCB9748|nr:serine hydrolase [Hyalangium gracile]
MNVAVTALAVLLSLRVGMGVGALGTSTVLAALPALLLVVVLPPVAVVGANSWQVRRLGAGSTRWGAALGVALGLQVLVLVGAILVGASARRLGDVALLIAVEAAVLPAVVMRLARGSRAALPSPSGALALLLVLLAGPRLALAACPERDAWPTRDWPRGALPAGREQALKAFEDYAFTLEGKDEDRDGVRTDGVVIIHRGRLVYERYARGFKAEQRHLGWSMSKSVTNALTALAVAHGALSLDDSICKHVKATNQAACAITVRHLLEFGSGLDWKEGYENDSLQTSSVLAMLYGEGRRDMVAFITSHALRDTPGTSWEYSSGDSTLLAGVVGAAMKPRFGDGWEWKLLLEPVGARSAVLERDGQGVLVGSSLMHATPRDWAKLGFFFLNDGCWEGQRLLPEGWMAASVAVSEPLKQKRVDWDAGDVTGRKFWLNRPVPGFQDERPWPDVPEDAYAMRGHWGQSVTIIPSMDLVVVRMADDRKKAFSLNTFLKHAIPLVEGAP